MKKKGVVGKLKSLTAEEKKTWLAECEEGVTALSAVTGSRRGRYQRKSLKTSKSRSKNSKKSKECSVKKYTDSLPARGHYKVEPKKQPSESDLLLRAMLDMASPGEEFTLQEIAEVMGISRERVRQIQEEALKKVYFHLELMVRKDGLHMDDLKR